MHSGDGDRRKSLAKYLGPDKILTKSFVFYIMYCLLRAFVLLPLLKTPREIGTRASFESPSILSTWKVTYGINSKGFIGTIVDLSFGYLIHITQTKPLWVPIVILAPLVIFWQFLWRVIIFALYPFIFGKPKIIDPAFMDPFITLAKKLNFPTHRMYEDPYMVNAGAGGIGQYSIMLIGRGLQKMLKLTDAEMLAVVGHELGHWALLHSVYHATFSSVLYTCYMVVAVYLMRNKAFYKSFDIETDPQLPIGVGLILITGFYQLFAFFTEPLQNYVSHTCEYQADAFSVRLGLGKDLISSMPKLHPLGNAIAQPIYGIFLYIHPVYSARIRAIAAKIAGRS